MSVTYQHKPHDVGGLGARFAKHGEDVAQRLLHLRGQSFRELPRRIPADLAAQENGLALRRDAVRIARGPRPIGRLQHAVRAHAEASCSSVRAMISFCTSLAPS